MGLDRPVLADQAAGRGPAGVEIAKGDDLQPVGGAGVGQDLLAPQFGAAIGGDGRRRLRLGDRPRAGVAIDGAGAGEDEGVHARGPHPAQQAEQPADIVAIVVQRRSHRFRHDGGGGEMQDGADVMLDQGPTHQFGVPNIPLNQRTPAHKGPAAGRQIVQDDGTISGDSQGLAHMGADIARAARDQDRLSDGRCRDARAHDRRCRTSRVIRTTPDNGQSHLRWIKGVRAGARSCVLRAGRWPF